ncbi:MAG: FAD-dependent oxidoreductase [Xanthomonadales bacterium]|nr:FAD-dependent oxidoreductase [Xanthomonadales bacterium]
MNRLVLAGGGHAHLSVLQALAEREISGVEVVLVTPSEFQDYSGMLPGWIAGHYALPQCQINLQHLVQSGNVRMVTSEIADMNADQRCVRLADGQRIEYDLLSLDTGSEIDTSLLELTGDKLLPAKPLAEFFSAWPRILSQATDQPSYRLVIVGGGAAGVELALAARHAFKLAGIDRRVELVVSEGGLLEGHAHGVKRRVMRFIDSVNIVVHRLSAVGTPEGVLLADGTHLPANRVIAATGKRAPCWLKMSKLKLDEAGFIAVDGQQRSLSHSNVFAAGDVCARQDMVVERSGVHAVHSGPILAANLRVTLTDGTLKTYRPRRHSLYLLACGPQYAIASWGPFSAEGKWVWRWKDWIDRRFVERFSGPEQ